MSQYKFFLEEQNDSAILFSYFQNVIRNNFQSKHLVKQNSYVHKIEDQLQYIKEANLKLKASFHTAFNNSPEKIKYESINPMMPKKSNRLSQKHYNNIPEDKYKENSDIYINSTSRLVNSNRSSKKTFQDKVPLNNLQSTKNKKQLDSINKIKEPISNSGRSHSSFRGEILNKRSATPINLMDKKLSNDPYLQRIVRQLGPQKAVRNSSQDSFHTKDNIDSKFLHGSFASCKDESSSKMIQPRIKEQLPSHKNQINTSNIRRKMIRGSLPTSLDVTINKDPIKMPDDGLLDRLSKGKRADVIFIIVYR